MTYDEPRDDAAWDDSHETAGRPATDDDTRFDDADRADRGDDVRGSRGRR